MRLNVFKPRNIDRAAYLIATRLVNPSEFRDSFRVDGFKSPKECVSFAYGIIQSNEVLFASDGDKIKGFFAVDDIDTRDGTARPHVHFWETGPEVLPLCRMFLNYCREEMGLRMLRIEIPVGMKKPCRIVEHMGGVLIGEIPDYYGEGLNGVLYAYRL